MSVTKIYKETEPVSHSKKAKRPLLTRLKRTAAICALAAAGLLTGAPEQSFATQGDPETPRQWYLQAIKAPQNPTGRGVRVAFLDSGKPNHEDINTSKIIASANFTNSPTVHDVRGHATQVIGIAAAERNNGKGGTGVAPDMEILIAKVINDQNQVTYDSVKSAVDWAVGNGAQIINASFVLPGPCQSGLTETAINRGVLIVAASGNDGFPEPGNPSSCPKVLAVGSSDIDGRPAAYSNKAGIYAPGLWLLRPTVNNGYTIEGIGTSLSAPMITATAALLKERNPHATADQLYSQIMATADGNRLLDVQKALMTPIPVLPPPPTPSPTPVIIPTPTPNPDSCNPRPPVKTKVEAVGNGNLRVTVNPGKAPLIPIEGRLYQVNPNLGDRVTVVSANPNELILSIRRNPNEAIGIPLIVKDACGAWQTLAGAGTGVR